MNGIQFHTWFVQAHLISSIFLRYLFLSVNIWIKFLFCFDAFICSTSHGFRILLLNNLVWESVKWTTTLCIKPVIQTCENNVFIKHESCFGCIVSSFISWFHRDFEDYSYLFKCAQGEEKEIETQKPEGKRSRRNIELLYFLKLLILNKLKKTVQWKKGRFKFRNMCLCVCCLTTALEVCL